MRLFCDTTMEKQVWRTPDVEKLIELYRDCQCLWDVKTPGYRDRLKKNDAIKEIASELATDEGEVGRKLHNLRSQYSNERKKQASTKSGSEGGRCLRKWEHYESLYFLNDSMDTRKSVSNLSVSQSKRYLYIIWPFVGRLIPIFENF